MLTSNFPLKYKQIRFFVMLMLAIFSALTFPACETITEIELPVEKPKLVVNSHFSADSLVHVNLTESRPVNNANLNFKIVENASIEVFKNTVSLGFLSYNGKGNYLSAEKLPFEANAQYSLKVKAAGFESVETVEIIPAKPVLESGKLALDAQNSNSVSKVYTANLTLNDTAEDNFYFMRVFLVYPGGSRSEIDFTLNNNLGQFNPLFNERRRVLFDDKSFNGKPVNLSLEISESYIYEKGDFKLEIELGSTGKSYYEYQFSAKKHINGDPVFNASDGPVSSNIKNGLGIFAPYNSAILSFDVPR